MVTIPPITIVMTGGWFMALFYPHYPLFSHKSGDFLLKFTTSLAARDRPSYSSPWVPPGRFGTLLR